jgi:Rrf2 family protein
VGNDEGLRVAPGGNLATDILRRAVASAQARDAAGLTLAGRTDRGRMNAQRRMWRLDGRGVPRCGKLAERHIKYHEFATKPTRRSQVSYSTTFPHAILALLYVTDKVRQGLAEYVPIQQISSELNIPPSTTGLIIRYLSRAGLVETREGAKGGIRPARTPDAITVYDIFKAIEQERPVFQTNLHPRVTGSKPTRAQQTIVSTLRAAEDAMRERLQDTTLADLARELTS